MELAKLQLPEPSLDGILKAAFQGMPVDLSCTLHSAGGQSRDQMAHLLTPKPDYDADEDLRLEVHTQGPILTISFSQCINVVP